jgi:aldehyde dehydrogenase (NAD+)
MNSKLSLPLLLTLNTIATSNDEKNIIQLSGPLSGRTFTPEFVVKTQQLKSFILKNATLIHQILSEIQPFKVTTYEIKRSVKTLDFISTNSKYYQYQVNIISVYMPSNLPLYSFILFGIIPSFMVKRKLIIKPNQLMRDKNIFDRLCDTLNINHLFQNVEIIYHETKTFTDVYVPSSDIVIFTGYNKNRDKILSLLKPGSLLINNGSGHNPIVVGKNADAEKAAKDACYAKFFNSGQDCAGPDAILIHKDIFESFMEHYLAEVKMLKVGTYDKENVDVGPIPRKSELQKFLNILHETDNEKIIAGGIINLKQNILYPTVICDQISDSSNLQEIFGPISFVYTYDHDDDVSKYFNDKNGTYAKNKMYVSLYGQNDYVECRNDERIAKNNGIGIVLHDKNVHDNEEGHKAYGGYSLGASGVYLKISKKTYQSKALPIYIPEIIAQHVDKKLFPKYNTKSTKKAENHEMYNLIKPFKVIVDEVFGSNLVFGFIHTLVIDGKTKTVNIPNVFVCLWENDLLQNAAFINRMKQLMPTNELINNIHYETISLSNLENVINEPYPCHSLYAIAGSKVGVIGDKTVLSSLTSRTNNALKFVKSSDI